MKTSTVLIASGDERNFYRSVQEVPEPMRSRLIETTNGSNSGTIVIADRAGKDQISNVMSRRGDTPEVIEHQTKDETTARARRLTWLAWMALCLILILGTVLSILFHVRW